MFLILATLIFLLTYFEARHSDPYEVAERFLYTDARVKEAVGPVARVDFRFWDGFEYSGGEAKFTFTVIGRNGASVTDVHLRSLSGAWSVLTVELRDGGGLASRIVGFTAEREVSPIG
jgi:hypothetical protein